MQQSAPAPAEPTAHAAPTADGTEALTRAIARGDTGAFGLLYERWFDRAYAAARRLTGRDEAFCLDVVQEAMLKAARRIPTLASEAALSAWLCRVVHRAALDCLRAERRRIARERQGQPSESSSNTGREEQIDWLRGRLRELSTRDRGLLAARFARGRTLEQAGDEAGLSGDAAHGRVRRILNGLRRAGAGGAEENTP